MIRMTRLNVLMFVNVIGIFACVAALVVGMSGCGNDGSSLLTSAAEETATDTDGDPGGFGNETEGVDFPSLEPALGPLGAVASIEKAYESRNMDLWDRLFNAEIFSFRFDPIDVEEHPDLPSSWGYSDERTASRNMFEAPQVLDIQVAFQTTAPVEADEGDDAPPGSWRVDVTDSDLAVTVEDPQGGDPIIYKVSGDRAVVFVRPDEGSKPEYWRIVEWRDVRVGGADPLIEDISWGQIKALFR